MSDYLANLRALGFWKKVFLLSLGFVLGIAISGGVAFAMGKPAPTTGGGGCGTGSASNPVRKVQLRHVGARTFHLPNGATVDMNADLDSMLVTSTANTQNLQPASMGTSDPCETHLEISAAVTSLELDALQFGVSFGFTPQGEIGTVTNIKGSAQVKIGTIGMDFAVWECRGSDCSASIASTATHLTAGVQVDLTIDFGTITTGPSLVYNTPLGAALRKIMDQGMSLLSGSAKFPDLPWYADLRQYSSSAGTVLIDVGTHDHIGLNQAIGIYSSVPVSGGCPVYKAAAYAHLTEVDTTTSQGQIDSVLDANGVQVGDRVMLRAP